MSIRKVICPACKGAGKLPWKSKAKTKTTECLECSGHGVFPALEVRLLHTRFKVEEITGDKTPYIVMIGDRESKGAPAFRMDMLGFVFKALKLGYQKQKEYDSRNQKGI